MIDAAWLVGLADSVDHGMVELHAQVAELRDLANMIERDGDHANKVRDALQRKEEELAHFMQHGLLPRRNELPREALIGLESSRLQAARMMAANHCHFSTLSDAITP